VTLVSILTPCFRGEPYLEGYFEAVLAQTALEQIEVVLVHNEPSPEELAIIASVNARHPGLVRHVVVPEGWDPEQARGARARESVSRSMNRGVAAASGAFVALWNVDDVRLPDSVEAEARTLREHPDALMTYGDMVMVRRYGDTVGDLIASPEFDRATFMRGCFGGFQMWRREALDLVGPFDEQLRSGADFDLWVRFAANGELVRTPQVLGYYLNAGTGLSTSADGLQPTERTVVELRYGILDKIEPRYLARASRYRVGELRIGDDWVSVEAYVPGLSGLLASAATDPRLEPRPGLRTRVAARIAGLARRARATLRADGGRQ
jgi:hypothetical protein